MSFEETVKDFVATRPRRPHRGRIIAGVAAGIGRRYGIDPVIVRVGLVVAAFYGGAGVIFYLLGWLLLAAEGDEVSPFEALIGRGRSSMSRAFTIVLCICVIPSVEFVIGGWYSTVAGGLLLAGGLYLLHRYRGDAVAVAPVDSEVGSMSSVPGSAGSASDASPVTDQVPAGPPAWDPLGAAPFAWDLPEPGPAVPAPVPVFAPEVRRRRSRIGLATLGVAFVVGAVLSVFAGGWLDPTHIVGILAGVVGVGLVAGSFVRGGRGLIPLAVLLSGAGFLMTSAHFQGWHGAGNALYEPTSFGDVQSVYQRSVGDLRLDLTQLPINTPAFATTVKLGVGDATVIVPSDADVIATCSASVGNVDCLGQRDSGPNDPTVHASQNRGAAGDRLHIILDVQGGPGNVRVISEDGAPPVPPVPPTK